MGTITSYEDPRWVSAESSQLLVDLVEHGEGQGVEFKSELPQQGHDIGKSIAAFASSGTGYLLYGVSDDGTIVGLPDASSAQGRDGIARRITQAASHVRPPVQPAISWAVDQEKVVCVVRVERGIEAIYYSNHRPIVRVGPITRPADPAEVEQAFRSRYARGAAAPRLPSTREIASRMQQAINLMNEVRYDAISVADLAKAMGMSSPAELDTVLQGHTPPTFAFLDQFCDRFAVDKEWIATGRGSPFSPVGESHFYPGESARQLTESKPEVVYVVRSTSDEGEAFFVAESDPLRIWRVPGIWHVSAHVGGGGTSQLLSLYKVFKGWSSDREGMQILGRQIQPKVAEELFGGFVHPAAVARLPLSHWWDDLTDLEQKWTTRKESAKCYGKSFVDAQDIIRRELVELGRK